MYLECNLRTATTGPASFIITMQFHYAENTARPDSDIDIAVIVDKLEGDYMDELAKLYKLRRSVDFRIEPVLFEYGQHKSGFLKEIMDTGYVLYPSAVYRQPMWE